MAGSKDFLDQAAVIAKALRVLGFEPVLVGGMALVILGSRRVTRDFDFVIAQPGERIGKLIDVFYDRGLELASRLSDEGDGRRPGHRISRGPTHSTNANEMMFGPDATAMCCLPSNM